MSIEEHPRLVNEIPRGSKRYYELNKLRSASGRANATLKEDLNSLNNFMSKKISHSSSLLLASSPYWTLFSQTALLSVLFAEARGFLGPMRPKRFRILFTKLSSPTATSLIQMLGTVSETDM